MQLLWFQLRHIQYFNLLLQTVWQLAAVRQAWYVLPFSCGGRSLYHCDLFGEEKGQWKTSLWGESDAHIGSKAEWPKPPVLTTWQEKVGLVQNQVIWTHVMKSTIKTSSSTTSTLEHTASLFPPTCTKTLETEERSKRQTTIKLTYCAWGAIDLLYKERVKLLCSF